MEFALFIDILVFYKKLLLELSLQTTLQKSHTFLGNFFDVLGLLELQKRF
jgi:hypothetical protein